MRKPHILKENKTGTTPRYKIYCDSESRVIDLKHYPYLMEACFIDDRYQAENWKEYEGNFKNFWHDVAAFGGKEKTAIYIYGHNICYDLMVTGGIPSLLEKGFVVTSFFEKGTTFILTMRQQEKYISGKGEEKIRVKKTLNFISTTNYFSFSLAALGEIFGMEKLEFDYENGTIEDAKIYCKRDVEICKMAMETFINFVESNNLGTLANTTPGQAFNSYRHRFMKEEIFLHDNENAFRLERAAYCGGRVECFRIGEFTGDFYGFDINSMYPFVMKNFRYPVKMITVRKRNTLNEVKGFIKEFGLIGEFTVRTEKPVYPLKLNENLIFPVGEFKTVLSTPEIIYGFENDLLIDVGEIAAYYMEDIFSDYVEFFYRKRLEAREEDNKVYDLLFKLFMNSLYGKFGQKSENWQRIGDAPPEIIEAKEIVNIDTGEREAYKIFGGSTFKRLKEEEAFNSFCAIAAHVTAYARMELLKYIELSGWENVYYMDTDSLFLNKEGADRLEAAGVINAKDLGKMKLEKVDNVITINAPKDYIFAGTVKTKGIKKGSKKIEDEKELTELALKMRIDIKDLPGRIYNNDQWPRLNSFIRAGNLSSYYNIKRTKIITGYYNKGWLLEDGEVKPFIMEMVLGENSLIPFHESPYIMEGKFLKDPTQARRIEKKYRKSYGIDPEKEYQQQFYKDEKELRKQIRKAVMNLGGVNDPDYEYLPRWCKRKTGKGLDYLAAEITAQGFPVEDAEGLYLLITEN